MAQRNSQQNNNLQDSGHVQNPLTPPSTARINNQQQLQLATHENGNDNVRVISSSSMWSTSSEIKTEDGLFDKIEDMMCEYMREPSRRYLHCRVLRWGLDTDSADLFTAVIVINPPIHRQ